jgi:hypothetical protein
MDMDQPEVMANRLSHSNQRQDPQPIGAELEWCRVKRES